MRAPATIPSAAACLALALASAPAGAQGLDQLPVGATHLGLAGAAVAGLDEPGALWVNPAELAALPAGLSVAVGAAIGAGGRSLTPEGLPRFRDAGAPGLAPALTVAGSLLGGRLVLAGGYRQQRQIRARYVRPPRLAVPGPDAGSEALEDPLRYLGSELTLADHRLGLGLALRLGWLRLGAAAEVALLSLTYRRTLWAGFADDSAPLSGTPAETTRHDLEAALDLDGVGYGLRFGVGVAPTEWLQLGLSLGLTASTSLSGPLSLGRPCDESRADCAPARYELDARGGAAELDLALPLRLAGGLALRPARWLRLLLAVSWRRWSSADGVRAELAGAAVEVEHAEVARREGSYPVEALPLGLGLRDALGLHAGIEVALAGDLLQARLGWALHRGATVADQPSPVALDLDRHVLAAGLQARAGGLTIAVGFAQSVAASLSTAGERATLVDPLASADEVGSGVVGAGDYRASGTRVMLELRYSTGR